MSAETFDLTADDIGMSDDAVIEYFKNGTVPRGAWRAIADEAECIAAQRAEEMGLFREYDSESERSSAEITALELLGPALDEACIAYENGLLGDLHEGEGEDESGAAPAAVRAALATQDSLDALEGLRVSGDASEGEWATAMRAAADGGASTRSIAYASGVHPDNVANVIAGSLGAVRAARADADEARDDLMAFVEAAVESGASKKEVAEAAGVTRQTLDRWLGAWERKAS